MSTSSTGVGVALRSARVAKQMSLSDVAGQAGISVATLSRIETEKQTVTVSLLVALADIIGTTPAAILGGNGHKQAPTDLARELAALSPVERTRILVRVTKQERRAKPRRRIALNAEIETLLAAIDLLVAQIAALRREARRR